MSQYEIYVDNSFSSKMLLMFQMFSNEAPKGVGVGSHLYELHLHNLNRRLPDEMPDECPMEKASENSCTSASASLAHRLSNVRDREIFQTLETFPEMAISMRASNHLCFSSRPNAISDWSPCSPIHLSAHCFSALNDVRVIDCLFGAAAAVVAGAECLRFGTTLCSWMMGTLLHLFVLHNRVSFREIIELITRDSEKIKLQNKNRGLVNQIKPMTKANSRIVFTFNHTNLSANQLESLFKPSF